MSNNEYIAHFAIDKMRLSTGLTYVLTDENDELIATSTNEHELTKLLTAHCQDNQIERYSIHYYHTPPQISFEPRR